MIRCHGVWGRPRGLGGAARTAMGHRRCRHEALGGGINWNMEDWENNWLEEAVKQGETKLQYVWGWQYKGEEMFNTYVLNLVEMTQTNVDNGVVRDLLRMDKEKDSSPYSELNVVDTELEGSCKRATEKKRPRAGGPSSGPAPPGA